MDCRGKFHVPLWQSVYSSSAEYQSPCVTRQNNKCDGFIRDTIMAKYNECNHCNVNVWDIITIQEISVHYLVRNYKWRLIEAYKHQRRKKGKKMPPRACCQWSGIQALEEKGTECSLKGLLSLVIHWDDYKSNSSLLQEIRGVRLILCLVDVCRNLYIKDDSATRLREQKMSLLSYIIQIKMYLSCSNSCPGQTIMTLYYSRCSNCKK